MSHRVTFGRKSRSVLSYNPLNPNPSVLMKMFYCNGKRERNTILYKCLLRVFKDILRTFYDIERGLSVPVDHSEICRRDEEPGHHLPTSL